MSTPDPRAVFAFLAATDLPMPKSVDLFSEHGLLTLQLPDNHPDDVDLWTAAIGSQAPRYSRVLDADSARPWRSYGPNNYSADIAGWQVRVWCLVHTDVVPPQPEGGAES